MKGAVLTGRLKPRASLLSSTSLQRIQRIEPNLLGGQQSFRNQRTYLASWSGSMTMLLAIGCLTEQQRWKTRCDDEDEDPYENLPEEDEETHCSMCKTFRQGPCRPQWRKLERCFKDHENEEDGASTHCMKYFTPHQKCLTAYTNLYQLISLNMKQELVRDAELSVTQEERRSWTPTVDWTMWKKFVADVGTDYRETLPEMPRDTPLWKRFPENTEPVIIPPTASVPKEKDGMILKLCYAVDQDGIVLGFSYNEGYGKLLDRAKQMTNENKGPTEEEAPPTNEADLEEESGVDMELEFYVVPGETSHVTISAMYAEDPTRASPEKEILDALLYTGPKTSLKKIVETK